MLAVVVYGVSTLYALFLWRRGFRQADRVNYLLLLGAFGLHTVAMFKRGMTLQSCPVQNLYEATTFAAWAVVLACLAVGLWRRMRFLAAFAAPLVFSIGVFALMPALDPPHGPKPQFSGAVQSLHASLILLAYGAFGLGSVAAGMFLFQEHNLKFHKLRAVVSLLPPVQRLALVTRRLVQVAFGLLTVGLILGGRLPRPEGVYFHQDPKVVWSGILWLLYLGLLVWHWRRLSTRRFAWGVIGVFVFVLLTFWGTNLLSPLHNPS
jgi:ABC-type uncharacterized transport system permease subunit